MKISIPKDRGDKKPIEFKFEFPEDFILVIDTREQDMLFKHPRKGLTIVRDTLKYGDYSIRGFQDLLAVERKNLSDLFGSIGKGRERFKAELEGLSKYERKWLLIEATEDDVLSWQEFSLLHPNVARGFLTSLEIRYGIGVYYQPDRRKAERWILDRFIRYFNLKRKGEI
jgi:ERCC4-type nuclease